MATITTTYGDMDEGDLVLTTGRDETEDAVIDWSEYRRRGDPLREVVRRDVHATIKEGSPALAAIGLLGG